MNTNVTYFPETKVEKEGLIIDTRAPVTTSVCVGEGVAAGFGDGVVRFFQPSSEPVAIQAHSGVVLSLAADEASGSVLTGGDDGKFLRIFADGTVKELASFGSRWVDCVAVGPSFYACSLGELPMFGGPAIRRRGVRASKHGRRSRLRYEGPAFGCRALWWGHGLETR